MNRTKRAAKIYWKPFGLAACLVVLGYSNGASLSSCEREVCIDLEHLPNKFQFSVPPAEINYVLNLPAKPSPPVTVYVHLMRAKANGEFEIVSSATEKMFAPQVHPTWDPSKTYAKKRGERFKLAATLDGKDKNPRSVTREFSIKWGENQ
jgi:hypothetical protein